MPDVINKVVIHELIKEKGQDIQPSNLRDAVLRPDHRAVEKMVEGIVSAYGSRDNNANHGVFKEDARGAFPDAFNAYLEQGNATDDAFMALSRIAMDELHRAADGVQFATGGYIVFVDYFVAAHGRFFLMAMVKQKPGLTLTNELNPEELMQLDLSRLHQAARVGFDRLAAYSAADELARQELSYLSFVSPSAAKETSGYFVRALGCTAGVTASKALDAVFREGRRFFLETDPLRDKTEAFKDRVISLMEEKIHTKESVRLSEIGHIVAQFVPVDAAEMREEIVGRFIERLNSDQCGVPGEFPVHDRTLRKYTHISGKTAAWQIKVDRSALGDDEAATVYYDRAAASVVLRNIPQSMINDIEETLADRVQE